MVKKGDSAVEGVCGVLVFECVCVEECVDVGVYKTVFE